MDKNSPPALCKLCQKPVEDQFQIIDQSIDPRFLRSDYFLSDEERSQTKSILEDKERSLKQYEKEIVQIRQILLVLEEEKRALEDGLLKCRSALGIWRKLPSEILEIIFEDACSESSESGHSLVIDCSPEDPSESTLVMSPVLLSHVCSRWRSIVLGSPKLWSSIFIHFDNIPEFAYSLLQTFIERSGRWHLSIRLQSKTCDHRYRVSHFWEILLENSARWKTLDLYLHDMYLLEHDPYSYSRFSNRLSFSNLLSLDSSIEFRYLDLDGWFWKSLCRAPNLTEVSTTNILSLSSFPYTQLTALTIYHTLSDVSFELLLGVLRKSRNLLHLTFDVHFTPDPLRNLDGYSVVQMPSLRSLEIIGSCSFESYGLLHTLFSCLRMPVLESFELECSASGIKRWPEPFLAMLDRSPSLKRLYLWFEHFGSHPEEPLSMILKFTPNLTYLEIRLSPWNYFGADRISSATKYLHYLVSDLKRPTLLPKLEYLLLVRDYTPTSDSIPAELLEVAESRGAGIRELATFEQYEAFSNNLTGQSKVFFYNCKSLFDDVDT